MRNALLALVLALPGLVGCSSGPKGIPVHGKVTLDGKPMPEGQICFKTVQAGVVETIDIKDGEFQGKALEGDRRVEIYSFRENNQVFNGMKAQGKLNIIPNRYNIDSTMKANVTPAGPNEFTFEVASK